MSPAEAGPPRRALPAVLMIAGGAYAAVLLFTPLLAPYRFPIPYAVPIFDCPFALVGLGIAYLCLERHRLRQDLASAALGVAMLLAALLALAHVATQPDYPGTPGMAAGVAPYFFFLSYLAGLAGIGLAARSGGRPLPLSGRARGLAALATIALALGLTLAVLHAQPLLPPLVMAPGRLTPFAVAVGGLATVGTGCWALWGGRRALRRPDEDPFASLLLLGALVWMVGLVGFLVAPVRYGVSWYVAGLARPVGVTMIFVALIREQVDLYREKARLYAEVEASLARLRETQAQLVQADKLAALGTLLSGMAHELNNPLSTIQLSVQLAKEEPHLPEALRERLDVVDEECRRALSIIRDLLLLARRRPPERTRVDLNQVVRATLGLEAAELDRNGIRVVTELGDVPPIRADVHQLQQVLLNVCANAVHAMRTGPGRRELTVRTACAGDHVCIQVEDDGPGIPAEHLARIFDPFFTTKGAGEGTGLGLSVSLGIVEAHGGRMTADNVPGRGARFSIHLPVGTGTDEDHDDAPAAVPAPAPPARVLVVDDELHLREAIADVLARRGHEVDAVATGADALARLAAEHYDVIVLDLRMPDVDGKAVWASLVARDPAAAERVVFMTGDTMSPDAERFLGGTGRPVLAKPFAVRRLLEAVQSQLAQATTAAATDRARPG